MNKLKLRTLDELLSSIPDYQTRKATRHFYTALTLLAVIFLIFFSLNDHSPFSNKINSCRLHPINKTTITNATKGIDEALLLSKSVILYPSRLVIANLTATQSNKKSLIKLSIKCNSHSEWILSFGLWTTLLSCAYFLFIQTREFLYSKTQKCYTYFNTLTGYKYVIIISSLMLTFASHNYTYLTPAVLILLFKLPRSYTRFNFRILTSSKIKKTARRTNFSKLDSHVRSLKIQQDNFPTALAQLITKKAENDFQKVYCIYKWITENISYDTTSYFSNNLEPDQSVFGVLRRRNAICFGYAVLFVDLVNDVGIDARIVHGVASGFRTLASGKMENHAWVKVIIHGEWLYADPTWDAGSVNINTRTFQFSSNPYQYFLKHKIFMDFTHQEKI